MKTFFSVAISFLMLSSFSSNEIYFTKEETLIKANHSGGTDRNGCHHDRKRGGYHCH